MEVVSMSKQTKDAKHFDVDVKVRDFCSKSKLFFIIGFALILISLLSTFTGVDVALEFKGGYDHHLQLYR